MINLQEELKGFRFQKKGSIIITEGKTYPAFDLLDEIEKSEGNVYLWVKEIDDKPSQIIYIGMTSKTISDRCETQTGGFKGTSKSKKGLLMSDELKQVLGDGKKITIYVRPSETMKILGQDNVSLYEVEEKALIARYKDIYPLLNGSKSYKEKLKANF